MTRRKPDNPAPNESFFQHGKIPPQAVDLEEAVLGAMMLEKDSLYDVINFLRPEVFYKEAHQVIYTSCVRLFGANNPVDILTVTDDLRKHGELEMAGSPYYITMLTNRVASSANIMFHATIIMQKYIQREIIRISSDAITNAYEDTTDVFELLERLDNSLMRVQSMGVVGTGMQHISTFTALSEQAMHKRIAFSKEGKMSGVPTGLTDLDKVTRGWQKSDLIVLASRPGMGKTASMIHFIKSAAHAGFKPAVFSLEMQGTKLSDRLILSEADIPADKFNNGYMSEGDVVHFYNAKNTLDGLDIYIDDNPVVSMNYIRAVAKQMKKKGQLDMICADYLQLADMTSGEEQFKVREQQVASATRKAKLIAKELDVPFILLSQLNREGERKGGNMRPNLTQLRESGAIEQDADIVMFIFRPEYYGIKEDDDGNPTKGCGEIIIAKHRDGSCKDVRFKYNDSLTKFYDFQYEEEDTF